MKHTTLENKADIERINTDINLLKENLGKFVVYPDEKRISTVERTLAKNGPKQVVILANKKVGSAAESFLITAKQSKKVKIMGTPTYGGLDYASVRETDFDCLGLSFYMPTNRSARLPEYPIDNIGIQPDIYLDSAVDDWTQFAVEYLEN